MKFSIKSGNADSTNRKAFRAKIPGFKAVVANVQFDVKDLSASGFSLNDPTKRLKTKKVNKVTFYLDRKVFLSNVPAEIVRIFDSGLVGFNFGELNRQQMSTLDKLILEVQKKMIEERKKQQE